MSNARPLPNRRARETTPELEAKIEAFAMGAETLQNVVEPAEATNASTPPKAPRKALIPEKQPKNRSYTFRMTDDTLNKLRAAAEAQDRSIQWVFDRVLLPQLDK